ncbi:hypothetical protein [Actinoplanes sp. NPDC026619]|uniref:hypothetical protein n=1 Tax=Actinoplanes sp. NPDC026619 TaxID=3155798 RepID=UPI0033F4B683
MINFGLGHEGERDDALVTVFPEETEGFESGVVLLPTGVAELTPQARAELALETVHAAATRLGCDRGWVQSARDRARAHVLAAGLRYRCRGPAKTSPDRKHVAQAVYAIYPDGYGRAVVQIRRRDDGTVVAVSPLAAEVWCGYLKDFAREPGKLRWPNRTTIAYQPGMGLSIGPSGATVRGHDRPAQIVVDRARAGAPVGHGGLR